LNTDNRPIGVFDSGVGGLSVLLEIKKILPKETFIFLADQKNVPYGGKSKEQLVKYLTNSMEFFETKNVKAVVFACNTATVYGIDEMRQKFKMPIIGTVPVIKTIAKITKSKKTVVFSTPATAKSQYLKDLIEKFADGVEVIRVGGSNLEELVEEGKINDVVTIEVLKKHLKPLMEDGVDAIALGCTHYPFLRDEIVKIVGPKVKIVDSGGAVARHLKQVLENERIVSGKKGIDTYFTTGDLEKFVKIASKLLDDKIEALHINIDGKRIIMSS
jgi:glutamate racemase